jgi:hypothetical protein
LWGVVAGSVGSGVVRRSSFEMLLPPHAAASSESRDAVSKEDEKSERRSVMRRPGARHVPTIRRE